MKRYLFLCITCIAAVMCFAQPPRGHHRNDHRGNHQGGGHNPRQERIICATSEQMTMVMKVLNDQSFDDKKADVAKLCVYMGTFCTSDLSQMAKTFSFDDNRLDFLKYAYQFCSDPQNYPTLRDCFTFSSNYDKLLEYMYPEMQKR